VFDAIDNAKVNAIWEKNGDAVAMGSFALLRDELYPDDHNKMYKSVYYYKDMLWASNLADTNVAFDQSNDANLTVTAGKDNETGDIIIKLINDGSEDILVSLSMNGTSGVNSKASVIYMNPSNPGDGTCTGYDAVDYGATKVRVTRGKLSYTIPALSIAAIRVHGAIDASPVDSGVVGGHTYKLISERNGTALNAESEGNGAIITQRPDDGRLSEKWTVTDAGGGYFIFTSAGYTPQSLTVCEGSSANGAKLETQTVIGNGAQKFKIQNVGGSYYRITPKCGEDCNQALDAGGWDAGEGAKVQTWGFTNAASQRWQLIDATDIE
jgi:hypothetical protein